MVKTSALGLFRSRPLQLPSRVQRLQRRHVCTASYFPHHRLHLTPSGVPVPQVWRSTGTFQNRTPQLAPEPASYPPEQLADLLNPAQWQLAYGSFLEDVQAKLQALALLLTQAYEGARALWQYVVASWPAWSASLCEDVEYVVEYALGVLPAWLVSMRVALQSIYRDVRAAPAVQQMVSTASGAVKDVGAHIDRLRQAVAETNQMASYRLADSPPLQQLMRLASGVTARDSTSSNNVARGLTHSMALLTAADLAAKLPSSSIKKTSQQRGRNESSSIAANSVDGRLQLMGLLPTDVQHSLRSGQAAASSSLQQLVVQPLQQAGFITSCGRGPTLAGVIAAASVLLAASVYRGMQRQAQQAEERLLQQVQLQMKAESLAAQRARFRRALDDSQAADSQASSKPGAPAVSISTRRRVASSADTDAWEDTRPASPIMSAGLPAPPAGGARQSLMPQLDAAAAREYAKFMAGARAMDVPMWDSHMVDDLPKISMKELQRQTQKIRSAATEEERAAMEDTEQRRVMVEQQLNSQLAELSGAPLGRAASEAWRKEQQQRKEQEEQQEREQAAAAEQGSRRGAAGEGRGSKAASNDSSNPFAVSREARVQWEAEDHLYSDPNPKKGKAAGGWGFGKSQQQQQQQNEQQQQQSVRRRRFADEPTMQPAAEQPVSVRRDDAPHSSSSSSSRAASSGAASDCASVFGSTLPLSSSRAVDQPQQQSQGPAAAAEPAEGTPEWEAKMRADMLANAAARRARRQQMMQQHQGTQNAAHVPSAAPAATTPVSPASQTPSAGKPVQLGANGPAGLRSSSLPMRGLQRPRWPGAGGSTADVAAGGSTADVAADAAAAVGAAAAVAAASQATPGSFASRQALENSSSSRLDVLGRQLEQEHKLDAADSIGGSRLAAVSARDAQEITAPAAAPGSGDMQRLSAAAAATAEATAEARAAAAAGAGQAAFGARVRSEEQRQEMEERNPFAVDRSHMLDDDTAFEFGKEVDEETKRIRLL